MGIYVGQQVNSIFIDVPIVYKKEKSRHNEIIMFTK